MFQILIKIIKILIKTSAIKKVMKKFDLFKDKELCVSKPYCSSEELKMICLMLIISVWGVAIMVS